MFGKLSFTVERFAPRGDGLGEVLTGWMGCGRLRTGEPVFRLSLREAVSTVPACGDSDLLNSVKPTFSTSPGGISFSGSTK